MTSTLVFGPLLAPGPAGWWWAFLLGAAAADVVLGDPFGRFHPVCVTGLAVERLETIAGHSGLPQRTAGALAVTGLVLLTCLCIHAVSLIPFFGWIATAYLAYAGLSLGGLLRAGRRVAELLERGETERARREVAGLVSRETEGMDEAAIARSAAESVSENFNDGFTAPFLFLAFFGVAGLWAYKTVSTFDSMWGYTTPRWRELGWFGARADDVLAWIPARISAACLALIGIVTGRRDFPWMEMVRQARRMSSPNAGWPMAAAAWAMNAKMGGPAVYFGRLVEKPTLGPPGGTWTATKLSGLIRLVAAAGSALSLIISLAFLLKSG